MLVCEMASYYKSQKTDIFSVLKAIYQKYGYYYNLTLDYAYEGIEGTERIKAIMKNLRDNRPDKILGKKIVECKDYSTDEISQKEGLPKADVIIMMLEDGTRIISRPSGTEPKIKFYYSVVAENKNSASEQTQKYISEIEKICNLKN